MIPWYSIQYLCIVHAYRIPVLQHAKYILRRISKAKGVY